MRATSQIDWAGSDRARRRYLAALALRAVRAILQIAAPHKNAALAAIFITCTFLLAAAVAFSPGGMSSIASPLLAAHLVCDAMLITAVVLRSRDRRQVTPAGGRPESALAASRSMAASGAAGAGATALSAPGSGSRAAESAWCPTDLVTRTDAAAAVIADDTTILEASDALPRILGRVSTERFAGRRLASALNLKEGGAAKHFCEETIRLGRYTCDLEARSAGRGTFWVEASGESRVVNGRPCILLVLRDVSDRKTAELELRRSCQELTDALRDARKANDTRSGFVAKMNHELRTPLNGIIGLSEMLRHTASDRSVPGAEIRRFCEHIHRSGTHLLSLVEHLLDLSRLEAGAWSLSPASIDVEAEVKAALISLVPAAHKKRVTVENSCPPGAEWVVDQRSFRQIVINLAGNAVKFSRPGSTVRVVVTSTLSEMTLNVVDEGPGIPAQELDRIARPFGRGSYAVDQKIDGVGLGLSIVSELLRLHGGRLSVQSEVGRGSTFAAIFPLDAMQQTGLPIAAE